MTRHLVALSAGLSQPSSTRLLADRLLAAASAALDERGVAHTTEVVGPRFEDWLRELPDGRWHDVDA